jgi:hypothetical protein
VPTKQNPAKKQAVSRAKESTFEEIWTDFPEGLTSEEGVPEKPLGMNKFSPTEFEKLLDKSKKEIIKEIYQRGLVKDYHLKWKTKQWTEYAPFEFPPKWRIDMRSGRFHVIIPLRNGRKMPLTTGIVFDRENFPGSKKPTEQEIKKNPNWYSHSKHALEIEEAAERIVHDRYEKIWLPEILRGPYARLFLLIQILEYHGFSGSALMSLLTEEIGFSKLQKLAEDFCMLTDKQVEKRLNAVLKKLDTPGTMIVPVSEKAVILHEKKRAESEARFKATHKKSVAT